MELWVVKTGFGMFDALHALGLSILVATANSTSVKLKDEGAVYSLSFKSHKIIAPVDLLKEILPLPSVDDLLNFDKKKPSIAVTVLDGLLAALFTTPGPRILSVYDLLGKQEYSAEAIDAGIDKVTKAIDRWQLNLQGQTKGLTAQQFPEYFLEDYDPAKPSIPVLCHNTASSVNLLMTLDPGLSYSSRQPLSDGKVANQTNITLTKPRLAPLMAYIGASRFLRSQRVNGKLINFYVPIPKNIEIEARTCSKLILPSSSIPDIALLIHALSFTGQATSAGWHGLAYQTMQTQGAKQSISVARGFYSTEQIRFCNPKLIGMWQMLFINANSLKFESDNLADFLLSPNTRSWLAHLLEWARIVIFSDNTSRRREYSLIEVKEVTQMIDHSNRSCLNSILLNDKGTIRFGHALRQLRNTNNSALRDAIDALETVREKDEFLLILSKAVEACILQDAKSEFMIIPDDRDLFFLMGDMDRFGVREVASILVILASLRYLRKDDATAQDLSAVNNIDLAKEESNG